MEAKIIRVSGSKVYIKRVDGLNTSVNVTQFCEADQKYIEEWILDKLIENGLFDISFSRQLSDTNRYEKDGIIYNECNMHFEIIISNNSKTRNFKDIRVDYLILKFEDSMNTEIRSWGEIKRIKGSAGVDGIQANEELRISTEKFPMLDAKLSNVSSVIGGREYSKDDIRGLWVKIYIGDKLAYDIAKPGNLLHTESWDN